MNKFLIIVLICAFYFGADARRARQNLTEKLGRADLELKACDFEKKAKSVFLIKQM